MNKSKVGNSYLTPLFDFAILLSKKHTLLINVDKLLKSIPVEVVQDYMIQKTDIKVNE